MPASIDQQFIEYIVKSLVSKPDAVKVERRIDEKGVLLELTVDGEDLGRVIGKRGATAQSLRTLLRALGTKNDARYNLKIIDTGAPPPPRERTKDTEEDITADGEAAADENQPSEDEITPQPVIDDDIDDLADVEEAEKAARERTESDVVSRTRKELAELDDLDV